MASSSSVLEDVHYFEYDRQFFGIVVKGKHYITAFSPMPVPKPSLQP